MHGTDGVGLTSLGWPKVFSGGRRSWFGATRLFNAQSATLVNLTLEPFFGSVGLLSRRHLDEAEATRILSVGIAHDVARLYIAVLCEQTRHVFFREARVNAGHEEVGSAIGSFLFFGVVTSSGRLKATIEISASGVDEINAEPQRTVIHARSGKRCVEVDRCRPHGQGEVIDFCLGHSHALHLSATVSSYPNRDVCASIPS